jgi:hypothetical protein
MAYRFKANESVPAGVIRIVCEQIDRAVEELSGRASGALRIG